MKTMFCLFVVIVVSVVGAADFGQKNYKFLNALHKKEPNKNLLEKVNSLKMAFFCRHTKLTHFDCLP